MSLIARACFCGCGRPVAFKLRAFDRNGRAITELQARLTEKALPLLDEYRTDHRMLRYVEETRRLARDGPGYVEDLRAIVHQEAPARKVKGLADWRRTARERCDTLEVNAELAERERKRGF